MEVLTEEQIRQFLAVDCPRLDCLNEIDSTNSYLKREALHGAPHGMVAVANRQSAGRGRKGRSFQSPPGKGLYLSVLLRPELPGEALMSATGMAAVAVSRAIERISGAKTGIKWTNDLILGGRKLCGILAETVLIGDTIALILGIGINVHHRKEDFDDEIAEMATSLDVEGFPVERSVLAAAVIEEVYRLTNVLGGDIGDYVNEYRNRCVTLGREARLLWTEEQEHVFALDVDEQFGLIVQRKNGTLFTVRTGEVSVRGLYGYIE
ncbi:MAG: biotin--[Oscillospiraceae bacterium]|nr:biotin--[acetyl-CoA-carboxylase] ligase [Oscillospiraceae bacterium]